MRLYHPGIILLLAGLVLFTHCGIPTEDDAMGFTDIRSIDLDLSDPQVQHILDLQDHLQADSLITFLDDENPTYRYLATRAFSSIIEPEAAPHLQPLLNDPHDSVRIAAAHALGQSGNPASVEALLKAFQSRDTLSPNTKLNQTVLEAVGRLGNLEHLRQLSSVTTYRPEEEHLLFGQAMGLYRFMIRGMWTEESLLRMGTIATGEQFPAEARMVAANYLARIDAPLPTNLDLSTAAANEPDPEVRMYLAAAAGKTNEINSLKTVKKLASTDSDYRVRINAIRALSNYPTPSVHSDLVRALRDPHLQVAVAASEVLLDKSSSSYWRSYMDMILADYPWPVKMNLHAITNKRIPPGNSMFRAINEDPLLKILRSDSHPYKLAAAIHALSYNPQRYDDLITIAKESEVPVVQTTAAEGLMRIFRSSDFSRLGERAQREMWHFFKNITLSGDVGLAAVGAQAFREQGREINIDLDTINFLKSAKEKLQLPRDVEAWQSIEATEAYLTNRKQVEVPWGYTHPIEWDLLRPYDEQNPMVEIVLEQGVVVIELWPKEAPATVANFLDLVQLQYYKDKTIHRVVPNFVIQGGCNRGDGYGSLDYNIRTETPMTYYDGEGYVGMASAGRHTECQQWFITHSPTPHLDGRYTIFGKVANGMDVVHNSKVGDVIEEIKIKTKSNL